MWEIHQSVASHTPLTGDLACNPGMCLDWESNQQPFGSQAWAQSTKPHQQGQIWMFLTSAFTWHCWQDSEEAHPGPSCGPEPCAMYQHRSIVPHCSSTSNWVKLEKTSNKHSLQTRWKGLYLPLNHEWTSTLASAYKGHQPWLVWLSGLSVKLWTKRSLVQFPVRAHA